MRFKFGKVIGSETDEAGTNSTTNKILAVSVVALFWYLDLEPAGTKAQLHYNFAFERGFLGRIGEAVWNFFGDCSVFFDLIQARDAQVNATLTDKGWDVGGGEEDEGNWKVLDESNVKPVFAAELNIGALEQVQSSLIQAALWWQERASRVSQYCSAFAHQEYSLLGTAKSRRPWRLWRR